MNYTLVLVIAVFFNSLAIISICLRQRKLERRIHYMAKALRAMNKKQAQTVPANVSFKI